jgi:fatty-acyl-CoA synthase
LDSEGYLWITGRVKDLIIRGGHNIEPNLIEEPAHRHPAVQLAAAVGRPDRHAGELPVLYVQLKPNVQATEEDIATFIAPHIQERAAIPKAVHILAALPLSGPGKISKLELRREAARATLQGDVDSVMSRRNQTVRVQVVDDPRFGQIAELHTPSEGIPENAREAVDRALAGYTLRSRWHRGPS